MDLQQCLVPFGFVIKLIVTVALWVYLQIWDGIAGRATEKKVNLAQMPDTRQSMVGADLN